MLNFIEKHKDVIKNFRIDCYDQEGDSYRIKIEITFANNSRLFLKEYLFSSGERKYAFNWVDARLFLPTNTSKGKCWLQKKRHPKKF